MDIYILHAGQQIGPFSEDATQILLQQGTVSDTDLAWRPGGADWLPLKEVLAAQRPADSGESAAPPATPAAPTIEPATAAQIAFLSYFAVFTPKDLSKEDAEEMITKTTSDPKSTERLALWKEERVRLHPELFAQEANGQPKDRVQVFFERCTSEGAKYFSGVTKAHCQVLVTFLDVKFPRWDAQEANALEQYFFPAMAEKFPQLVNKQWKGRLHYGRSPAAANASSTSHSGDAARKSSSPFAAIVRGILFGLVILAALYAWQRTRQNLKEPAPPPAEKAAA